MSQTERGPTDRPMRADAQRNRERILEAAAATFAAEGIAVPVDVVAERAGVGVGTLYRHFPTKEALFEAIVADRIDALVAMARAPDEEEDPAERLFSFLAAMANDVSAKHDLMDALAEAGFDLKTRCADKVEVLQGAIDRLRRRAVEQGEVRDDVTTDEIVSLVVGVCLGSGRVGGMGASVPLLRVVCDGLRVRR